MKMDLARYASLLGSIRCMAHPLGRIPARSQKGHKRGPF